MKNTIKALVSAIVIGGMTMFAAPAEASRTNVTRYNFNKNVGNGLYVYYGEVYKTNGGARTAIKARIRVPKCSSRYYLYGSVWATYNANDGGYIRNFKMRSFNSTVRNYEGTTRNIYTSAPYRMTTRGTLRISNNLTCKSLAPLRGVNDAVRDTGRRIDPTNRNSDTRRILRNIDPTKGIFW